MPVAAIPKYLGQNFDSASPGLRFGMYLPIWTARADQEADVRKRAGNKSPEGFAARDLLDQGMDHAIAQLQRRERKPLAALWSKNDFAARQAWEKVCALTADDRARMAAFDARQRALAASLPAAQCLSLHATATAPFTTGLGNEHPLENGFAFLTPYGLPYLAGSGVKGVLRQAARELASGEWGDRHDWGSEKIHQLERINLSVLDVLFGAETDNGDSDHVRGVLGFWDVMPQVRGTALMVEIMTPHQSHYYQQKAVAGSMSPHDSGGPNPISFLTVPPQSGFSFHVVCDLPRLERLAPDLAENERWKTLLRAAFEHAFDWLGFGAKTAVGYGAMQHDHEAEARAEAERSAQLAAAAEAGRRQTLSAMQLQIDDFITAMQARKALLMGRKDKPNTQCHQQAQALVKAAQGDDWSAEDRRAAADAVEEWLPQVVAITAKDARKALKLGALRGDG